jgi:predicted lipoprotein with Yx(FWY)xxD motif
MSQKKIRWSWLTLMVILTVTAAACSPAAAPAPAATAMPQLLGVTEPFVPVPVTPTPVITAIIPNTGATAVVPAAPTIMVSPQANLGQILTDAKGMTLYAFLKDQPDASNCSGACVANWPPLTVASDASLVAGKGASVTLGTITRSDGSRQVTVNHMPVYYWAKDAKPGDATGQGVGSVWYVLDASGAVIKTAMPSAATPMPTAPVVAPTPVVMGIGHPSLGLILADDKGMTLYAFTKDTPGVSNCSGDCATLWPPLLVAQGAVLSAGEGLSVALGTLQRADGTTQVTVNGQPVYYWADDSNPGDTGGQGVGGVWFVLNGSGNILSSEPPTPPEAPTAYP